jgi:hypothetical protein
MESYHLPKQKNPHKNLKWSKWVQPRPAYRVPRDQRFEAIRKRFEQQREADKNTPDPHADMWDKDWINKP